MCVYSLLASLIFNRPRNKRFASVLIEILRSPPILALPDWGALFQRHIDASGLGAATKLTRGSTGAERVIVCESVTGDRRWTLGVPRPNDRSWRCCGRSSISDRMCLWVRRFVLITGCSALTWLLKSQALSVGA